MVLSMTGYGKSEVTSGNKKYTVEVRSLNGKNSDISLKSSILPKDKDLEFRQYLTRRLVRGNIDVFLTSETVSGSEARRIDPDLFRDYFRQLSDIAGSLNLLDPYGNVMSAVLMSSVLRLPDVVAVDKDELTEEDVEAITGALHEAVDALIAFRTREGAVLKADLLTRVDNIEAILAEVDCTLADVAQTTVYLTSLDDMAAMNEVYARRFTTPAPARAVVGVNELPLGALIEMDCVACR